MFFLGQESPKSHERPEWQIAAERLLEAVERKSLMFAEAAIRKAVIARKPSHEPPPSQDDEKMKRKLRPQPTLATLGRRRNDAAHALTDKVERASLGNSRR